MKSVLRCKLDLDKNLVFHLGVGSLVAYCTCELIKVSREWVFSAFIYYTIIAGLSPHVVSAMRVSSFIQTASLMRVVVMHAVLTHTAVHVGWLRHRQQCQSSFNQSAVFLQHGVKNYLCVKKDENNERDNIQMAPQPGNIQTHYATHIGKEKIKI